MGQARSWTHGLAFGAGLMFLLDPRQGGGRRALVRDKSRRAVHEVEHAARIGAKDLAHRLEGLLSRLLSGSAENVPDETLVERVRARLGHVCAHPHAVHVRARGLGEIELEGPIEADEADHVVAALARVPGVQAIDDALARVPHLPGGRHVRPRSVIWTPTTRLLLGVACLGVAGSSLVRGRPLSFALGLASVLALARNMVTRGGMAGARAPFPSTRSPGRGLLAPVAHEVAVTAAGAG